MKNGIRRLFAGLLATCVLAGSAVYAEGNPYAEMEPAAFLKAYHEANQYDEYLQEKYLVSDFSYTLFGETKHVILGPNDYCYYSITSEDGTLLEDDLSENHVVYGYPIEVDGRRAYRIKIADEQLWENIYESFSCCSPIHEIDETEEITNIHDVDGATAFTLVYPADDEYKAYFVELGLPSEVANEALTMEEDIITEEGSLRPVRSEQYAVTADARILIVTATFEYPDSVDNHEREEALKEQVFGGEETYTVTLTVAPGTENEKTYTVTANKDALIDYWVRGTDQTYDVYSDEACTVPYEGFVTMPYFDYGDVSYIPVIEDVALFMK